MKSWPGKQRTFVLVADYDHDYLLAEGVEFEDGTVVVRWKVSNETLTAFTAEHASFDAFLATIEPLPRTLKWTGTYGLGIANALNDRLEGVPYASVGTPHKRQGGVRPRDEWEVPYWVREEQGEDPQEYFDGYEYGVGMPQWVSGPRPPRKQNNP